MKKTMITLILIILAATSIWAVELWYCPMHPQYQSDKAGSCPICGMDLVKKENAIKKEQEATHQVAGYVPVHMDAAKQQLMGVRTTKVVRQPFVKMVRAVGQITYDPELYKEEAEYVEDYIAYKRLDRRLNKASYTIQDAERKLKQKELDLIHMGATEQVLSQLRNDRFPDHSLLLPEGGDVQIYAQIFEHDLGFVDVGQKAIVEVPAYHQTFEGVVISVDPIVDPATRSIRVRIKLFKIKDEFKSNMLVNVTMPVELNLTLLVPRDAIMMTGTRAIAFVKRADGVIVPKEVQTGWESDGLIEIKQGLKEGEDVVSGANFLVDSESRLQAALAGLSEGVVHE